MISFSAYWGAFLLILKLYYWHIDYDQILMYIGLLIVIWGTYKDNYAFSNSAIEISYDSHHDPVIIPDSNGIVKANHQFTKVFGNVWKFKKFNHYTQLLYEIVDPDNTLIEMIKDNKLYKISIQDLMLNSKSYNNSEFVIADGHTQRIFSFISNNLVSF